MKYMRKSLLICIILGMYFFHSILGRSPMKKTTESVKLKIEIEIIAFNHVHSV